MKSKLFRLLLCVVSSAFRKISAFTFLKDGFYYVKLTMISPLTQNMFLFLLTMLVDNRLLAVRQARVRISARHPREGPLPSRSLEDIKTI